MFRRMLAPLRRSVRAQMLALVLAPLLVGVPVLLVLVWTWGNEAYQRLLISKVRADLIIAHEYFDRVKVGVGRDLQGLADSARLARAYPGDDEARLRELLMAALKRSNVDFLQILDASGRPVAAARGAPTALPDRTRWPAVAAALAGHESTHIEVFGAQELAAIDPALAVRAHTPLVPTPAARPDDRVSEDRGLMIHAAAPIHDLDGRVIGVLEGGVLLNGNLAMVDRINAIVYREGSLPLGSQGTATLFLGDTRVATNVKLFEDRRALGTRVSAVVYDYVIGQGKVWHDTAFVVNDFYVSGYEPFIDGSGRRVGMLYVGFLEAPLRTAKQMAMGVLFGLFVVISLIGSIVSLRWARAIFKPVERMNRVIAQIEQGDAAARIGELEREDELGRVAREFDHLLDSLASKREQLEQWADELDHKVAARTAELAEANDTLRRAQQQLVMSEKLAAVGELTAGVAHEINNPVAVIQGNLDVLTDILGPQADPVREEIRLIHQQVDRIRQIVTKLLQFARPGEFAGYAESVDVPAVIADCLVLARHTLEKRGVTVAQRHSATGSVEINRSELQQVLINLIVNAVQAMADGGTLTLTSEDWMDGENPVGVRIGVSDTGPGIAEDDLDRIFDAFFTTKKGSGTGLGLSISQTLVQRYGGRITANSAPGEGSVFHVWLLREADFAEGPTAPGFRSRWHFDGH
ncbi:HAMP domain-containing protein [Nitrogeniibacter mangrovi]|uniref:histidine kinase n=1 Tax=Nitrogeniibacter mangrovi TaxID=2016596 RepID=A0A6C1B090_9RHOO|nr:cache domain-containing protein [Nitrogeniibacter mangrovi]QID16315.1 HAMP domain-containing protein [Nitrogeniibacter mangrovi]